MRALRLESAAIVNYLEPTPLFGGFESVHPWRSIGSTMTSAFSIRPAREQDCLEIARLASQLGYPASGEVMRQRLQRLLASPKDAVFVAEGQGRLGGWIHGVRSQFLESDLRVEIGGLVVDDSVQRQGIGGELVKRVEVWAVEQGVTQVVVRCRTTRAEAHLFYESLGYTRAKSQIVFRKALAAAPTQR